ncbi:YidB family protein [Streptomyces sp. NPDC056708]|uniref:YidB family protein n=1 Tax=unclassified Streptomyces TaxID=2593676 RepID=UPI00368DDF97
MSESEPQAAQVPAAESVALRLPQVASWIGPGANEPVTAAEITKAIGEEGMERLAGVLGKDPAEAAEYLADRLPKATDASTSGRSATPSARRGNFGADTLLVLFNEVPDEITIREPAEGIHFGLN